MPAVARMTAAEYLARPRGEGNRSLQLIGGELVVDPPLLRHQLVCAQILVELGLWTRAERGRGLACISLAIAIGEHDVYEPDLLWYREDRAPSRDAAAPYPVPDLVVEVRSPSTWRHDIGAKKSGYERRGVAELWLVDTAADEILVFRRSRPDAPSFDVALQLAAGETLTSPLLPGLRLALTAVFG